MRKICTYICLSLSLSLSLSVCVCVCVCEYTWQGCTAGVSRSVALISHYLMRAAGLSFKESMHFIRRRHPAAAPNPNFIQQVRRARTRRAERVCGEIPYMNARASRATYKHKHKHTHTHTHTHGGASLAVSTVLTLGSFNTRCLCECE